MNSIGNNLRLTTFGESHGPAIGGVLDGFPPGMKIDYREIESLMATRRPGGKGVTARKESDRVEFLSGFNEEGLTLGTPIGFIIRNEDKRSEDYEELSGVYRPNHADYTTELRYGLRDYRGGGRASARETACRVVAGALALQYLDTLGIKIDARLLTVGDGPEDESYDSMMDRVEEIHRTGDSVGATVECRVSGIRAGIGNPVYDKLSARLGFAMLSINAVMGFEYGEGFRSAGMKGAVMADEFYVENYSNEIETEEKKSRKIRTKTNHCGGIQGGISNGEEIYMRVAFKPTPTIARELHTVTTEFEETTICVKGRHDPCVGVRGVAVVRSMAALTIADFMIGYQGLRHVKSGLYE